jgi:dihydroxyacid dehydratase/phosphogluconate dehydratase
MGTASTMNALAEALGMTLPGSSAIPAPFRERMAMAYSKPASAPSRWRMRTSNPPIS